MLIAHKCPKCVNGDVEFNFNKPLHKCDVCDYTEDSNTFHAIEKEEYLIREIKSKVEAMLPFKDLSLIESSVDLAVCQHVLGKFDSRDECMKNAISKVKDIFTKWQICYVGLNRIEKKIREFERIKEKSPEDDKYADNMKSVRKFFENFPEELKSACE